MLQKINLLDLFSGIGGFHKGLEQAGFEIGWNGFSDVDKYANAVYQYNYPEAINLGSITTIRHKELPKIDCITFGSPCQDFSIAGKRSGMQGDRSSLITEAIRLIATLRPRFFIWENVKGTFSSNDGADFWAIIQAFANIGGYRLEWQLLNTRWFLPQNRERIYLVGCLGKGSGQKIFPIGENGRSHIGSEARAKPKAEFCTSITTREGGRKENNFVIVDKELKKKNNQDYAANLSGGGHSGGNHSDMDLLKINIAGNLKGDGGHECHNVHDPMGIAPAVRENHGKITMVKIADEHKTD
jgi:DNA (cytosine-5)-methyltransferase 1